MEHVQTLDKETLLYNEYNEEDSVILELDINICSPLLKNMFQPIISKYVEYYDNNNYRKLIIQYPEISIELFGGPPVKFVASMLTFPNIRDLVRHLSGGESYSFLSILLLFKNSTDKFKRELFNCLVSNYENLLSIIEHEAQIIKLLPKSLPNYPQMLVKAFKCNQKVIEHLEEDDFKYLSKELVIKCFKTTYCGLLQNFPSSFKSDRDVVLAGVKNDGMSLKYASDELKSDEEIVLAAIKENGNSLVYAGDTFKRQKSLKLIAIKTARYNSELFNQETDREILLPAVKKFPTLLQKLTHCISDREIVFEAVKRDGKMFKYASTELQLNRASNSCY